MPDIFGGYKFFAKNAPVWVGYASAAPYPEIEAIWAANKPGVWVYGWFTSQPDCTQRFVYRVEAADPTSAAYEGQSIAELEMQIQQNDYF